MVKHSRSDSAGRRAVSLPHAVDDQRPGGDPPPICGFDLANRGTARIGGGERAEIMQSDGHRGGLVHRGDVEVGVEVQHEAAQTRVDFAGTVGHAIHVSAFQCGEPRVESARRDRHVMDGDVCGQHALQTVLERYGRRHGSCADACGSAFPRRCRDGRPDARRARPCRCGRRRSGAAARRDRRPARAYRVQHPFDLALHGANRRLLRPSEEAAAVICQVNAQSHHAHQYIDAAPSPLPHLATPMCRYTVGKCWM